MRETFLAVREIMFSKEQIIVCENSDIARDFSLLTVILRFPCCDASSTTKLPEQMGSYSVCMLALVSSKAHSTDSGLRVVTLLHSICRFSLGWKTRGASQTHSLRLFLCVSRDKGRQWVHKRVNCWQNRVSLPHSCTITVWKGGGGEQRRLNNIL